MKLSYNEERDLIEEYNKALSQDNRLIIIIHSDGKSYTGMKHYNLNSKIHQHFIKELDNMKQDILKGMI